MLGHFIGYNIVSSWAVFTAQS